MNRGSTFKIRMRISSVWTCGHFHIEVTPPLWLNCYNHPLINKLSNTVGKRNKLSIYVVHSCWFAEFGIYLYLRFWSKLELQNTTRYNNDYTGCCHHVGWAKP